MQITAQTIKAKFPDLISEVFGDEAQPIRKISSPHNAGRSDICFAFKVERLDEFLQSQCGFLVIPQKAAPAVANIKNKTILLSPNPELAMALISQEYFAPKTLSTAGNGVHRSAMVSTTARLGKNVCVGPGVVIGENVQIGDGTQISANCVIEDNVKIGKSCQLYPLVFVGRDCEIGECCIIQSHVSIGSHGYGYAHDSKGNHYLRPHLGRVVLGKAVEVGAATQIDRGTIDDSIIGDGTKIDNLCHFGHNAIIGKNCLITAGFVSAGSVKLGDNFICGGRTTVSGHLEVGDNITIAAHSTVDKNPPGPGQYGGYPLVPMQTHIRNVLTTAFLAEMRKNINRLMKKVFPEERQQEK